MWRERIARGTWLFALFLGVGGLGASAPALAEAGVVVDATTLEGKVLFGYQGWFRTPSDDSPFGDWKHWFEASDLERPVVDFWPDLSEVRDGALEETGLFFEDGSTPAEAYSSFDRSSVLLHFQWMRDYGTDGAFIGRFMGAVATNPDLFDFRNRVLVSAAAGANRFGRVFAINYDVSDGNGANWLDATLDDWQLLIDRGVTSHPRYLHHDGKPVVKVFGIGFDKSTGFTSTEALEFVEALSETATVIGGVSTNWRTLSGDARDDDDGVTGWGEVYEAFDLLSPWAVTRFSTPRAADDFVADTLVPDLDHLEALRVDEGIDVGYLPVVWPGFSWRNLQLSKGESAEYNATPRQAGSFYWRQVYNVLSAGAEQLLVAQFDEVDEGTQMYKTAPTAATVPVIEGHEFVTLDWDDYDLPSDWYLQLADHTARALRGEVELSDDLPIEPAIRHEFGELSIAQLVPGEATVVSFETPFRSAPVVLAGPASFFDEAPTVVRIGEVTPTSFEIYLDEWDYLDGVHGEETVSYLALPRGTHDLGGRKVEVGTVEAVPEDPFQTRSYAQAFDEAPVVLAQPRFLDGQTVAPRLRSVGANSFQLRVQNEEAALSPPAPVAVDYVAWEVGDGSLGGRSLIAGRSDGYTDLWTPLDFGGSVPEPRLLATMQTIAGPDPSTLRYDATATTPEGTLLKVEEEDSNRDENNGQGETTHSAEETVGWLVIEGAPAERQGVGVRPAPSRFSR